MSQPLITICITTYNRPQITCGLLKRLFYCDEVEYLVVDDGSTEENLQTLQSYISDHHLSVQLFNKVNGGKLSALRHGLQHAKGKYFTDLDSDDDMSEKHILNIVNGVREVELLRSNGENIIGVCGLSETPEGNTVGGKFPPELTTNSYYKMRLDFKLKGNKVEVILTEKLKSIDIQFFQNEKRMPTNVQWFSLLDGQILFINKPFEVYFPNGSASISSNVRQLAVQSKNSTRSEYKLISLNRAYYKSKSSYLVALINYLRYSFHGASPFVEKDLAFRDRLLLFLTFPISISLWCRDMLLLQKKKFKCI